MSENTRRGRVALGSWSSGRMSETIHRSVDHFSRLRGGKDYSDNSILFKKRRLYIV